MAKAISQYVVTKKDSGSVETYRVYANTLGALREIAERVGFEINPNSNTCQNDSKLADFLNAQK